MTQTPVGSNRTCDAAQGAPFSRRGDLNVEYRCEHRALNVYRSIQECPTGIISAEDRARLEADERNPFAVRASTATISADTRSVAARNCFVG